MLPIAQIEIVHSKMENLFFRSERIFDLSAVSELAQEQGYGTRIWFSPTTTLLDGRQITGKDVLQIINPATPYPYQWECYEADLLTLELLVEEYPARMAEYASGSTYIIDFGTSTLRELIDLLKQLLRTYGGWIAVDDDMEVVWTADTLDDIVKHELFNWAF